MRSKLIESACAGLAAGLGWFLGTLLRGDDPEPAPPAAPAPVAEVRPDA